MMRRDGTDPATPRQGLSGEMLLVGAVLRQAVADARKDQPLHTSALIYKQAVDFLLDDAGIEFWANIVGADADGFKEILRREAGLL